MTRRIAYQALPSAWQERYVRNTGRSFGDDLTIALRFIGRLDLATLRMALADLVERHEALRTTLDCIDGKLRQVIWAAERELPLDVVDLTSRDRSELNELLAEIAYRPTQPGADSLFHASLALLGRGEAVLLLRVSHLIADGWSCSVIVSDLGTLYAARASGAHGALPPLLLQARHHADEERAAALRPERRAFWREQLDARERRGPLPVGMWSPTWRDLVSAPAPISRELMSRAAAQAAAHRATPAIAMLAATAASIAAFRDDHVVLGWVHANRYRLGFERVVGNLVEIAPLRIDLSGDPTFGELMARAREAWLAAMAHRMPIADVLALVGYEYVEGRDLPCDALVNCIVWPRPLLAFSEEDDSSLRVEAVALAAYEPERRAEPAMKIAPVELVVHDDGRARAYAQATTHEGMASPASLDRACRAVVEMLECIANAPDRRIRSLSPT